MNEKDFLKSFKTQIKQIQAQFKAFTTVNKSSQQKLNLMGMNMDFKQNFFMKNLSCYSDENSQEDHQRVVKFLKNKDFFQLALN